MIFIIYECIDVGYPMNVYMLKGWASVLFDKMKEELEEN